MAVLKKLWKYLYKFKWLLLLALVLTLSSNLLALVGPKLSGLAIDAIEPGPGAVIFENVFRYCLLMVIFYIFSSVFSYILSIIMIRLGKKVACQMRQDVFDRLMSLPVSFFDTTQTGDIINRISYDIDTINATLSTDFVQIFTSIITVVGSLIMMLTIAPILVLVFAVTIPISLFFTRYMTKRVKPLFRKRSAKLGELNGYIEEILSGHKTVKAYCREDVMTGRFDKKNEDAVNAYYEADYHGSVIGPSVNFINNLSLSLISTFGAMLFLFGKISLGNISSFVLYSRKFSGPINEIANIVSELQSATAAAERVFRLLEEAPEKADLPEAKILDAVSGKIDIEYMNFGYTPDKMILHNLNLHVKPGTVVAIVGPTGAGKTTIINLLMRFYDPQQGKICLDGYDITNVTRESLRSAYTMVLQDTWLFSGTIAENIAYSRQDASMEEIQAAAKAAHIDQFIEKLPDGYNTYITDGGSGISKGQKQLLTIARAMLADSHMLILDEATSNVDSRTEIYIQDAMRTLMQNKTCFVIAHRLSTIQNADVILVVRDGDIIEQGTHTELMHQKGFYYSLYNSQFA